MATTYDYNTGLPLAPGQAQSQYNIYTGQKIGGDTSALTPSAPPVNAPPATQQPTRVPTVISDSTIRNSTIPAINTKATQMLPPAGVTIGANGQWIDNRPADPYSQGQQPPIDTSYLNSSTVNASTPTSLAQMLANLDSTPTLNPETEELFNLKNSASDNMYNMTANQIRNTFLERNKLVKQNQENQGKVLGNTLAISGSSRYSPISSQNIISAKQQEDVRELNQLASEENNLIMQAQMAKTDRDMQTLGLKLDALEKKRAEKNDLAVKLLDKMNEENKQIREQKSKEGEEVNKLLTEAGKGGAPRDVLERAKASGSLIGALSELGDYLSPSSNLSGTAKDYSDYKVLAENSGVDALSPIDWYTQYGPGKPNATELAIQSGQLTPVQQSTFMSISKNFLDDSVMQNAKKGTSAIEIADRVLKDPGNSGGQLSILYTLIKSLDPTSAVREGEISLAEETQSFLGRQKTNLEKIANGQVISRAAAITLANETKQLAQNWYNAAQRREKDYRSQAKVAGIGNAFEDFLVGSDQSYSDIINKQKDVQGQIDDYYLNNPADRDLINEFEDRGLNDQQIYDWLKKNKKISFNPVAGDTDPARITKALGSIESGGSYNAVSPVNRNGERAYGKYQILASNIPTWGKEATGRNVTLSEFRNNPRLQDEIAKYKVSQLLDEHGNPDDVAAVWFSGRPLKGNTSSDVTGTNVPTYVKRFRNAYNNLS